MAKLFGATVYSRTTLYSSSSL